MKVKKLDNQFTVTATANFLEELAMSEYGAYEDGGSEATDLVEAFYHRASPMKMRNGVAVGNVTITLEASTVAYLTHPNGLALHIGKWRGWASMGDFGANAYVRSAIALQKHLETAIG